MEVVKQRMQVRHYRAGLAAAVAQLYRTEGAGGFYRGLPATLQREVPFAAIQLPLYEHLKGGLRRWRQEGPTDRPWDAAVCGSVAGGISAVATTPLDVVKTRTMLASRAPGWLAVARAVVAEQGGSWRGLFAGALPRLLWISAGGFVFFGAYAKACAVLSPKG